VLDSLHTHCPDFRSAYSTVSADGTMTVAHSAGTGETWSDVTPAVLSSETSKRLAKVDLVASGDDTTRTGLPALTFGDVPAVLQAPVRHATTVAGILSLAR
jgi:hypothetical protein